MINKNDLFKKLDSKGISYKLHEHKPLFTVEDSKQNRGLIIGSHSKNLFLKNKKNKFFLFTCIESTNVEIKKITKTLKIGNLSFANESYLNEYLGVMPGSVTPFGLLNDNNNNVEFYLDSDFLKEKIVNFHPLINSLTISLNIEDFLKFLIENNKKINIFNFNNYTNKKIES